MRSRLRQIFLIIRGVFKTFYFNFHYLPFNQAIRLPVLVSHRVWFKNAGDRVVLHDKPRLGMIWLGFGSVGIFDEAKRRSIWEVSGTVVLKVLPILGMALRYVFLASLYLVTNLQLLPKVQLFVIIIFVLGNVGC